MKKEGKKLLASSLIEAFSLIFDMYEEAIEKIPETDWANGEIEYLTPARLILHATEAADYYTTDAPEGHIWKKRFDLDPEARDIKTEDLPSKQRMLEYHHEVRRKIESWLRNMSEADLLETEDRFPWTGSTLLNRVLYIIAHHRQHFGEINAELRRRGLPRIKWRILQS